MKFDFFFVAFIYVFMCLSCRKEPEKGGYKGVFNGRYETETSSGYYTTDYYFDITHSTKNELRIKERQSQITSKLQKHEKDSISGRIGFGGIYNTGGEAAIAFNFISVQGKYDKKSILGAFSTTLGDGNKEYLSEGNFVISAY